MLSPKGHAKPGKRLALRSIALPLVVRVVAIVLLVRLGAGTSGWIAVASFAGVLVLTAVTAALVYASVVVARDRRRPVAIQRSGEQLRGLGPFKRTHPRYVVRFSDGSLERGVDVVTLDHLLDARRFPADYWVCRAAADASYEAGDALSEIEWPSGWVMNDAAGAAEQAGDHPN